MSRSQNLRDASQAYATSTESAQLDIYRRLGTHDLDMSTCRHVDRSTCRLLPSSSQLQVSSQAKQVRARQAPQRPTCVPALQHFTPLPGFHRPLPGLSDASQKAELSMCGKECWGLVFGLRAIAYVQSAPSAHKLPKTLTSPTTFQQPRVTALGSIACAMLPTQVSGSLHQICRKARPSSVSLQPPSVAT